MNSETVGKTAEAESSVDDSDTQLYSAAEAYEKAQADLKKATERQGHLNGIHNCNKEGTLSSFSPPLTVAWY